KREEEEEEERLVKREEEEEEERLVKREEEEEEERLVKREEEEEERLVRRDGYDGEEEEEGEEYLLKRDENSVARQEAIAAETQRRFAAAGNDPVAQAEAIKFATDSTARDNEGSTAGHPIVRAAA
ncbi:hypothetical protein BJ684DRAFT_16352, partial [Piptocephalis cylindrospora]